MTPEPTRPPRPRPPTARRAADAPAGSRRSPRDASWRPGSRRGSRCARRPAAGRGRGDRHGRRGAARAAARPAGRGGRDPGSRARRRDGRRALGARGRRRASQARARRGRRAARRRPGQQGQVAARHRRAPRHQPGPAAGHGRARSSPGAELRVRAAGPALLGAFAAGSAAHGRLELATDPFGELRRGRHRRRPRREHPRRGRADRRRGAHPGAGDGRPGDRGRVAARQGAARLPGVASGASAPRSMRRRRSACSCSRGGPAPRSRRPSRRCSSGSPAARSRSSSIRPRSCSTRPADELPPRRAGLGPRPQRPARRRRGPGARARRAPPVRGERAARGRRGCALDGEAPVDRAAGRPRALRLSVVTDARRPCRGAPPGGFGYPRIDVRPVRPSTSSRRATPPRPAPSPCGSRVAARRATSCACSGDLGAGKTQFAKGFAVGLASTRRRQLADVRADGRVRGPAAAVPPRPLPPRRRRATRSPAGCSTTGRPTGVALVEWADRLGAALPAGAAGRRDRRAPATSRARSRSRPATRGYRRYLEAAGVTADGGPLLASTRRRRRAVVALGDAGRARSRAAVGLGRRATATARSCCPRSRRCSRRADCDARGLGGARGRDRPRARSPGCGSGSRRPRRSPTRCGIPIVGVSTAEALLGRGRRRRPRVLLLPAGPIDRVLVAGR